MRLIKSLTALLLAMLTLFSIPVIAEEETANLVKQDPLLDAAFSMLEPGNPFLEKYNEITGAGIEPYFEYGLPYFFGGTHGLRANGELHLFGRAPGYTKRDCWEQTTFYDKGAFYLYGLDCKGYTRWICKQVGWPEHDELQSMILNLPAYGKKNHVYNSHVPGKEMPPYEELAEKLLLGDMLVAKRGSRHIMMFIGTLRDYGFTAETAPELADYLDYTLVIHCGPNPEYGSRMQKYLNEHADDPYYKNVNIPDGGVCVSIIGVPLEDAPHQIEDSNTLYHYFELPDGYKITIWDLETATSFCWFRINGI